MSDPQFLTLSMVIKIKVQLQFNQQPVKIFHHHYKKQGGNRIPLPNASFGLHHIREITIYIYRFRNMVTHSLCVACVWIV